MRAPPSHTWLEMATTQWLEKGIIRGEELPGENRAMPPHRDSWGDCRDRTRVSAFYFSVDSTFETASFLTFGDIRVGCLLDKLEFLLNLFPLISVRRN